MPACSLMRDVLAYSRTALLGLWRTPNSLNFMFVDRLSSLNVMRFRGSRAGQLTRVYQARSFVDKQIRVINHTSVDSDSKPFPITTIIGRRVRCRQVSSSRSRATTTDNTTARGRKSTSVGASLDHRCLHRELRAITTEPLTEFTMIGLFNAQSVGNKHAAVCDLIASNRLHLCAVVETWHDSADDPNLVACAPPDYRFTERARPRDSGTVDSMKTNHGGVCLFYKSSLSARQVQLRVY